MHDSTQHRQTATPLPFIGNRYWFNHFECEVAAVAWNEECEVSYVTYFYVANPEPRPYFKMDARSFLQQFSGIFMTIDGKAAAA